jgi:hypothetical protein
MSDRMHSILHSGKILCKPEQQSIRVLEAERFEQMLFSDDHTDIKYIGVVCQCWTFLDYRV